MKFCMVTTFFGAHSFGGDAAYVDRLSRALLRHGHQVEVIHSVDAFEAVRAGHPLRKYEPPPGLKIHSLTQPLGIAGLLWIHQTGRSGPLGPAIERILQNGRFDVIHFHNISLLGLDVIELGPSGPVRMMTAHEHWLVCPLSSLWKNSSEPCVQPSCFSCTLRAARPPQLWRASSFRDRMLNKLDVLLAPSEHTRQAHR